MIRFPVGSYSDPYYDQFSTPAVERDGGRTAGRPDLARLWFFATIVYSREITHAERLTYYESRKQPLPFDENSPAYGSVIFVEL